jgi:GGDEF domain-containing protein
MLKDRHDKEKPLRLPRQPQLPAVEQLRQMHQECVKHPGVVAELPFGETYLLTACRQASSRGCEWQLYQQESGDSMVEMTFDANDPRFVHQQIINYFPHWSTTGQRRTNEQPNIFAQNQTQGRKDKATSAPGQPKNEDADPIMEGDLSVLNLAALLRSTGRQQLTGHLHVRSGMNDAYIYVVDGVAVHCEFSDYEGPDAFRAVAALHAGKFFFYKGPRSERHTLPKDLEALIKSPMVLPPQKSQGKSLAKVVGTFPALSSGTVFSSAGTAKPPVTSSSDNLPKNPHADENPMELLGQSPRVSGSNQNALPLQAMQKPNQSGDFEFQKQTADQEGQGSSVTQTGSNQAMPPRQSLASSPGVPPSTKPFDPQQPLADQLRKRLTWSDMVPPAIGPTKPDHEKEPDTGSPGLLDLLGTLPENPARAPKPSLAELGVPENLLSENFKQQLRTGEHLKYSAPEQPKNWAETEGHGLPGEIAGSHPQTGEWESEPPAQPEIPIQSAPPEPRTGTPHRLEPPPMPWAGTPHGLEAQPQPQSDSPVQSATNLPAGAPFPSQPQPGSPVQSATNLPAGAPFPLQPQPDSPVQSATNLPAGAPFPPQPQPDSPVQSATNLPAGAPFPPQPQPDSPVQSATNLPAGAPFPSQPQSDSPVQSATNLPPTIPSPPEPQPVQHHSQPRISFYSEIPQPPEPPATGNHFNQTPDFAVPQPFPGFSQPSAPSANFPARQSDHEIAPADLSWSDPIQGFAAMHGLDEPAATPPAEPPQPYASTPAEPPPTLPPAVLRPIPEVSINPFAPPPAPPPASFMSHVQATPTHFPDPFPSPQSSAITPIPEEAAKPQAPPPAPPSEEASSFFATVTQSPDPAKTTKPIQDIAARLAARLAAQGTHDAASPPEVAPPQTPPPVSMPITAADAPAEPANEPAPEPPLPRAIFRPIPDFPPKAPVPHDAPVVEPPPPRAVFRPIPDFPAKKPDPAIPPAPAVSSQEADSAPKSRGSGPLLDFGKPTDSVDFSPKSAEPTDSAAQSNSSSSAAPIISSVSTNALSGSQPSLFGSVSQFLAEEAGEDEQSDPDLDPIFGHTPPPTADEQPIILSPKKERNPEPTLILPAVKKSPPPDSTLILPAIKKEVPPASTLILPAMKRVEQEAAAGETVPALILPPSGVEAAATANEPTLILAPPGRISQTGMPASAESTLILPSLSKETPAAENAIDLAIDAAFERAQVAPPPDRPATPQALETAAEFKNFSEQQPETQEIAAQPGDVWAQPQVVAAQPQCTAPLPQSAQPQQSTSQLQEPTHRQESEAESEKPEAPTEPPKSPPLSATAAIIAKAASKAAAKSAAARHDPLQNLADVEDLDTEPEAQPPELLFEPLFQFAPKPPPPPPEAKPAHSNPWLNLQQSRAKTLAEKEKEKELEKAKEEEAKSLIIKPAGISADPTKTLSLEEKGLRGYSKSDRQHVRSGLVNRETQLYTFAALMYFVELEFVRAMRYNRSFALLVLQVGHKSAKSKTAGRVQQLAADTMALLSTKIMDIKRPPDLLGHFDPAGLAIFMPDTDHNVASQFAARLAETLSQIEPAAWTEFNPLEFMIGVAAAPEDAHDMDSLTKEAAKYQARHILP